MKYLLWASMVLEFSFLLGLVWHSRGHVRRSFPRRNPGPSSSGTGPWPRYPKVAMIVPLTGNSPEMPAALESLVNQPYPNYETILITRDPEDPATPLVRELLSRHPRVRHIISGPATGCSQKNHNILAGIGALDDRVEILVFCDSTHRAPPNFLRDLIHPLVTGAAVLTTGFHRIIPDDTRLPTLGMLQSVLAIHLVHGFPTVVMPWGGATAILREVFQEHGIEGVLRTNVLDDFPLGQRLLQSGLRTVPVATAVLATDLNGLTGRNWEAWVIRQLMYLKYCLPGTWLAAAPLAGVLAFPIIGATLVSLGGAVGLAAPSLALTSLGFLLALSVFGAWCRILVPEPVPLGPWLLAFYANILMACWCYLKTWFTDILAWRGISYRITWGGRVKEIIINH